MKDKVRCVRINGELVAEEMEIKFETWPPDTLNQKIQRKADKPISLHIDAKGLTELGRAYAEPVSKKLN